MAKLVPHSDGDYMDILGLDVFGVGLFHKGKSKEVAFSQEQIAGIACDMGEIQNRDPYVFTTDFVSYSKLGHEGKLSSLADQSMPRFGSLRNWKADGELLFCDWLNVPTEVWKQVEKGGFPGRSVEIKKDLYYDPNGKTYPFVIDCMALIGQGHEEHKGLSTQTAFLNSEREDAGAAIHVFTEAAWPLTKEANAMAEEKTVEPKAEEPKATIEEEPKKEESPPAGEDKDNLIKALNLENELLTKKIEDMVPKTRLEKVEALVNDLTGKLGQAKDDAVLDQAVRGGQLEPAKRDDYAIKLAESRDDATLHAFSEGKMTRWANLVSEIKGLPVVIKLSEQAKAGERESEENPLNSEEDWKRYKKAHPEKFKDKK